MSDPGLTQCRKLLEPSDPDGYAAFQAAAEQFDAMLLVQLGSLPELPVSEKLSHPSYPVRTLYALKRCIYVCDIMGREVTKLTAILKYIESGRLDAAKLAQMVVDVALGDPIGCVCPPGENEWHPDSRRFDLIAHEILRLNGLRKRIAMELVRSRPEGADVGVVEQWEQLLRNDRPYPTWKE